MSLINDALRATRYLGSAGDEIKAPGPTYRIHADQPVFMFESKGLLVMALFAIAGAVAGGVFVTLRAKNPMPKVEQALTVGEPVRPNTSMPHASLVVSADALKNLQAVPATSPASSPAPPKLTLQGITLQGPVREAMINGYTLREGDEIEGARIEAIEHRRVLLRHDGRELVLRLH